MEHKEKGDNRTFAAVIRTILMVFLFAAVLLFAKNPVYADSDVALTVQKDGQTLKEFTLEELQQIAAEEQNNGEPVSYSFSSWDSEPSFTITENVHGPTVEAVLSAAMTSSGVEIKVKPGNTVTFTGADGETSVLTWKQLIEETRYFFPKAGSISLSEGPVPEEAYDGKISVKAIISTGAADGGYDVEDYGLYVGQVAPNDINGVVYAKKIACGGTININTASLAPKCTVKVSPGAGTWRPGKQITVTPGIEGEGQAEVFQTVYYNYVWRGSPDYGDMLGNYSIPVIPQTNKTVYLCAAAKGYGLQDSDIARHSFTVGDALTFRIDGQTVRTYDPDELEPLVRESDIEFSGYKSSPAFHFKNFSRYIRLDELIEDATGRKTDSFDPDNLIRITGSDAYDTVITVGQMFGTARYCYPNAEKGSDLRGSAVTEAAYEGAYEVPAVIRVEAYDSEDSGENGTFVFGQEEPNDQNYPECVQYVLSRGIIEISTAEPDTCGKVVTSEPAAGTVVAPGTEITFLMPKGSKLRDKINYIIDPEEGEIPLKTSALYNFASYWYNAGALPYIRWADADMDYLNEPVLSEPGVHTVALKMTAYGKKDGEVSLLRYFVGTGAKANLKATASSYNKIRLTWNKESGVSGYKLYRKTGTGGEKLYKTFGSGVSAFTDTGLRTGTKYTYRLAVTAGDTDGAEYEFRYSGAVSATPKLGTTALKLKAAKRKITLSWNRVTGANGYEIYRSTKKSSGYKRIKTIKSGSTVKYVNKSLKKGKRYYYKVRAYRTVNGNKVCGSYSAVKYTKAK